MFYGARSKYLPHFTGYLARRGPEFPSESVSPWLLGGCIGSPFVGVMGMIGARALGAEPLATFLAFFVAMGASLATGALMANRLQRRRTPEAMRVAALATSIRRYSPSLERKRLHRELDPTAAQLLEAGAFYWARIRDTLEGPYWSATDPQDDLRQRTRIAADQAMDELASMLSACVGTPAKTPQDDVRSIVDDFKEGDIEEALQGLKSLGKGNKANYTHRSPHIGPLFQPARHLAEQLQLLSAEVEQMASRAARQTHVQAAVPSGSDAIYGLLSEMHARRVAESELDDDNPQTQRT